MAAQLDILALEPFYGGARRAMLDTIMRYSRHRWTLLRLPPRRIERRLAAAAHWFAEQDVESMLAATVPVPVAAGDAIFVPAGLAHAIGAGILLLELQQPADLSLLLERHGAAEGEALLGLEAATALAAVHRGALPPAEVARLCAGRGRQPLPAEADAFFRAELVGGGDSLEAGFSILVGTGGAASLETEHGGAVPLRRGSTLLVPYAAGACTVAGDATAIRCRGPE